MDVVSISMPEALLKRIDQFVNKHGYSGRSEIVREGTRTLIEEFQGQDIEGQVYLCTVTATFEYCQPTVQQRLTNVRREYDSLVSKSSHTHAGDRCCVELFLLEGTTDAISEFINVVRAVPKVWTVNHSLTPLRGAPLDQPIR